MNVGVEAAKKQRGHGRDMERFRNQFLKEVSLWGLLARGSIYKILTILVIASVAEGYLFYSGLCRRLGQSADARFESVFEYSGASVMIMVSICLLFFVLLRSETETYGSRSGYTLDRLRVTKKHWMLVKILYNFLCFVLLFAAQAWIALWMCWLYGRYAPTELVSPQLTFLAFYRTPFLHNLLPLAEGAKWVRNLLSVLALCMEAAIAQGRRNFAQVACMLVVFIGWFVTDMGVQVYDVVMDIVFSIVILVEMFRVFGMIGGDSSVEEL